MPNRNVLPRPRDVLFPEVADINDVRDQLKTEIEAGRIVVPGQLQGSAARGVVNAVVMFYLEDAEKALPPPQAMGLFGAGPSA